MTQIALVRNSAPNQVTASGTSIVKCLRVSIPRVTEHQDNVEPQCDCRWSHPGEENLASPITIQLWVTNQPQLLNTVCSLEYGQIKNINSKEEIYSELLLATLPLTPFLDSFL